MIRFLSIFLSLFGYALANEVFNESSSTEHQSYLLQESTDTIAGKHLTLVVYELPGQFMIKRGTKNVNEIEYSGFNNDVIDLLADSLHFTFSYLIVPKEEIIKKGAMEAAIEYLIKKEADMGCNLAAVSPQRWHLVDFTVPIINGQYSMIQPMPSQKNQYFAPVKPFKPVVWLLFGISLAVVSGVISAINHASRLFSPHKTNHESIADSTIYSIQIITGRAHYLKSKNLSVRLVAGVWCLAALLFSNHYNSLFISFLTVPKHEPIVDSFEDLASSETLEIAVEKGTILGNKIMNAESGALKVLGDNLRTHPDHLFSLLDDFFRLLNSSCCSIPLVSILAEMYVYDSMQANGGTCQLTTSRPMDDYNFFSYILNKNFDYRVLIDKQLMRLRESGILDHLAKSNSKRTDKCKIKYIEAQSQAGNNGIKLYAMASAFIVLGIGVGLSLLVFALEIIVYYSSRRTRTTPIQQNKSTAPVATTLIVPRSEDIIKIKDEPIANQGINSKKKGAEQKEMIKAEKESITNQLKEENEVNKWSAVGAAEIEQSKPDGGGQGEIKTETEVGQDVIDETKGRETDGEPVANRVVTLEKVINIEREGQDSGIAEKHPTAEEKEEI